MALSDQLRELLAATPKIVRKAPRTAEELAGHITDSTWIEKALLEIHGQAFGEFPDGSPYPLSLSPADRLKACKLILDRAFGRSPQKVQVDARSIHVELTGDDVRRQMSRLTDDELRQFAALNEKLDSTDSDSTDSEPIALIETNEDPPGDSD